MYLGFSWASVASELSTRPPVKMASQFIGLHMEVVLREPSGYRLTGIVRDVEAGSSLTLTDGTYYSPLLRSFFFFFFSNKS